MKILEIRNLSKKDVPLHYRNEFTGSMIYETFLEKSAEKKLEFSLERTATGKIDVQVNLLEEIDYPLVPLIKTLKNYILEMDKKGELL